MNESLLGCLVWTLFVAVFLGLDHVLGQVSPSLAAWAPFPALAVMFLVWLVAMSASVILAERGRR